MVPIAIYGTVDFLSLVEKFKLQRKYRLKKQSNKEKFSDDYLYINDPMSLSNLGHVDFVCIDKTGTMTKPSFTISKLYANNKIYKFQDETLKLLTKDYNEKFKSSLSKYIPNVNGNEFQLLQSPTLKSNPLEEPLQSLSDLRFDEQIENKDFAKTRDFGNLVDKNKLMEKKNEIIEEKIPLNIPPPPPPPLDRRHPDPFEYPLFIQEIRQCRRLLGCVAGFVHLVPRH